MYFPSILPTSIQNLYLFIVVALPQQNSEIGNTFFVLESSKKKTQFLGIFFCC